MMSEEFTDSFEQELADADSGPPLVGRWHHGNGVLVSGSIRIAQWDCDTNPPPEFRERVLDWMCESLNAALVQPPTPQRAEPASKVAEDDSIGRLNGAVAGLQAAVIFLDQMRKAAKDGEDVTGTGAARDARQWLESSARDLLDALSTPPASEPVWTVRRNEAEDDEHMPGYGLGWDVLHPDGCWKTCVATDPDDARDTMMGLYSEEQAALKAMRPPTPSPL